MARGPDGEKLVRPGPLRWLWYAVGGRLPVLYSPWVLYDNTCPTWIIRYLARSLILLIIPVAVVLLFLPAPLGLRVLTSATAGGCALMFFFVWIIETTERRLMRAGYEPGIGEEMRAQRSVDSQRLANLQRRERHAAREARRRGDG